MVHVVSLQSTKQARQNAIMTPIVWHMNFQNGNKCLRKLLKSKEKVICGSCKVLNVLKFMFYLGSHGAAAKAVMDLVVRQCQALGFRFRTCTNTSPLPHGNAPGFGL